MQTVLHAFARQKPVSQLVYAGSSTVGLYLAKNGGQPSKKLAVKVATQIFPSSDGDHGQEHSTAEDIAGCFGRFFSKKCCLVNGDFDQAYPRLPSTVYVSPQLGTLSTINGPTSAPPAGSLEGNGPDKVPSRVLKECAEVLAPPFSKLFSLCFRCGIQPSGWKIANVVPVHKKKARCETKNYRLVSLLSIASKVMEKIINTSIMNFLERENLLSAYQFGFRSGLRVLPTYSLP